MSGRAHEAEALPPLVVLQSTPPPDDTTNPYLVQLFRAFPPAVALRYYSLRTALFGRYDLFHVHWPEYLVRDRSRLRALLKQAGVAALLLRLRLTATPVVRTLHNLQPHEAGSGIERWLLRTLDRLTTRRIRINDADDGGDGEADTILHGHYRDWYATRQVPDTVPGRLLYFGLIRPYKGVESLLQAFADLGAPDEMPGIAAGPAGSRAVAPRYSLGARDPAGPESGPRGISSEASPASASAPSLRVVGNPVSDDVRATIEAACAADARIGALLRYVDDDTLAREIGQAQLVVLPYRQMHNSGALLLALSLARPVLVPWSEANARIAAEVGPGWVHTYRGELTADALGTALRALQASPPRAAPDLSRRDWPALGRRHHATYARALRAARER